MTTQLQQTLIEFAQHIRSGVNDVKDPERKRRIDVYQELFFNNIEDFCSTSFPVLKSILDDGEADSEWRQLVRKFFVEHACDTPHFIEISEEFLTYLSSNVSLLPKPWLLELAHYEWVELAASTASHVQHQEEFRRSDLSDYIFSIPDATWLLAYNYPVQLASAEHTNLTPVETYIIVYRTADFQIQFVSTDALTLHLFNFIQQKDVNLQECISFLTADPIKLPLHDAEKFAISALTEFCARRAISFYK